MDQRVSVSIPGFRVSKGVWLGEGSEISTAAELIGPAVIGPGCKVEDGCRIGEYTVLGSNVRLLPDIGWTIRHPRQRLSRVGGRVRGAILGRACSIRNNARIDEGAVLGDEVLVGANATVAGDVKVYPFKTIEDSDRRLDRVGVAPAARSLFRRDGVTGLANVDMTPELAARMAMAYGTTLKKGATVVTSRPECAPPGC
ncbi:MAG: hypothetical protein R2705_14785 [Ilumatobacteraceae bacterium]